MPEELRALAARIADLRPRSRAELALIGHTLGVLYGLAKSGRLQLRDRTGLRTPSEYAGELCRVARSLARDAVPRERQWMAGFYFNSALYRLGALAERVAKHSGQDRRLIQDVSKECQRLKHEIEGLMIGRKVDYARTVDAAAKVVVAIERLLPTR